MDSGMQKRMRKKHVYSRLQDKSLKTLLERKLLSEYGFENMPKVAQALIDDVLSTVEDVYVKEDRLKPGQIKYLAVPTDLKGGKFGRSLKDTDLKSIKLTLFCKEDIDALKNNELSFEDRLKIKIKRLLKEAYAQGALLALIDLEALLSAREAHIQKLTKEINDNEELLPTRGVIHDLGRTITHKKQIINLRREGYLSPEIARKTRHDIKSVDRYLKAYEKVKTIIDKTSFNNEEISVLTGLSLSLVKEYSQIAEDELTGHMS